jgi:[pyruvate, water dikinase]-phosphate phosphotransferase / [pyruvate, water dikinase] kinase
VNKEILPIRIYVISDSVGETGSNAAKAVISQFRPDFDKVKIKKFPYLTKFEEIEPIVQAARLDHASIVFTLVEKEIREMLSKRCQELNVPAIDLLGPMIDLIQNSVNETPLEQPGLVHQLDDYYFKKIEAIEFAVKYDDGRDPRGICLADIVLVGVSRTSKTPLSQYLANKAYKVANVPLVPEVEPPTQLFEMDPNKCFGLVISPAHLNNIRKERLLALGLGEDASYAQVDRIEAEIEHFNYVVGKIGCKVIDVSNKAVEETANLIIDFYKQSK